MTDRLGIRYWVGLAVVLLAWNAAPVRANDPPPKGPINAQEWSVRQWLERWHEASRGNSYTGTFVVSAGAEMAASKIWHVCDGQQQVERIDSLTGVQRSTYRRDDEVVTYVHDTKVVQRDKREALRMFPDLLRGPGTQIDTWYRASTTGSDRVANFEAQVVDLKPKDTLRHGYRVWSDRKSGLVLKLQTRDAQDQVLEQVAFTELQLGSNLKIDALAKQMESDKGYQTVRPQLRKTTPEAEGWRLKGEVPGFQSVACHNRLDGARPESPPVLHWVFSDGLASVSLFVETFDPQKHTKEQSMAKGAIRSHSSRLGDHWVTALGEVPLATLKMFVQSLERTR